VSVTGALLTGNFFRGQVVPARHATNQAGRAAGSDYKKGRDCADMFIRPHKLGLRERARTRPGQKVRGVIRSRRVPFSSQVSASVAHARREREREREGSRKRLYFRPRASPYDACNGENYVALGGIKRTYKLTVTYPCTDRDRAKLTRANANASGFPGQVDIIDFVLRCARRGDTRAFPRAANRIYRRHRRVLMTVRSSLSDVRAGITLVIREIERVGADREAFSGESSSGTFEKGARGAVSDANNVFLGASARPSSRERVRTFALGCCLLSELARKLAKFEE